MNNDSMYLDLVRNAKSLRGAEDFGPMDAFINGDKVKVASMDDLLSFIRIGSDTLVHKAQKDLWRISQDQGGQVVIERLFNPEDNNPLRV